MNVYNKITDLVGNTPLVELKRIEEKYNLKARIIAKVESFNPAGSVKDRIAKAMIEKAENKALQVKNIFDKSDLCVILIYFFYIFPCKNVLTLQPKTKHEQSS